MSGKCESLYSSEIVGSFCVSWNELEVSFIA